MTTEQRSIPNTYIPAVGDRVVVDEDTHKRTLFRGYSGRVVELGDDSGGSFALVRLDDGQPGLRTGVANVLRFEPSMLRPEASR